MNNEKLTKAYYIILGILILIFFTKDINIKEDIFYKNIHFIEDPNNILVLVNKNNQLPSNYIPNDLEQISNFYSHEGKMLRKIAKEAFENLSRDASILGYRIVAISAYRDYFYQKDLFEYYVQEKGLDYALSCSSKPGHSEHQTGLSIDVEGNNRDYDHFEDSIEFDWMKENAHKYGFIMRYPKGKEYITGFKYEPWHYRYVGKEVAKYIYDNNLTLEEYLWAIK